MSADVPLTMDSFLSIISNIAKNNSESLSPLSDSHTLTLDKLRKLIALLQPAVDTIDALHRAGNYGDSSKLEACLEKLFTAGALICQARQSNCWESSNVEVFVNDQMNAFQQLTQQLVAKQLDCLATSFIPDKTSESFESSKSPVVVKKSNSPPLEATSSVSSVENSPLICASSSKINLFDADDCEEGLIFPTGVEVGYSESGKKPILLVQHPTIQDRLYVYRYMAKGAYRCISCGNMKQHRYGKLYQGVLYSNVHACLGKSKSVCEKEQVERCARFNEGPLPGLWELSHNEDPYPYPAYPKRRCETRSQNPDDWDDLVEFSNFTMGLSERSTSALLIVYDNEDSNRAYEYVPNSRGSFRCYGCMRRGKHVLAKINENRNVVQSASHKCEGITRAECIEIQTEREQRLLKQSESQ